MPLAQILAIFFGLSVLGNAWQYRTNLGTRTQLVEATGARDQARVAANTCSDATEALRELADKTASAGRKAAAEAAVRARQHQSRAQAILAAPAAVPGDDCRSAQARIERWFSTRERP
ncbi:MAG TPA: hypothetical protein VIL30_06290 [Ramlibacter sp.]|jgi:hypothetical protein